MGFESPIKFKAGTTVDKMVCKYPARCSAVMSLVGADIATTIIALRLGGGEANPIFNALFSAGFPSVAFISEIIVFISLLYLSFLFAESEFKGFQFNLSSIAGHYMFFMTASIVAMTVVNNCGVVAVLLQ